MSTKLRREKDLINRSFSNYLSATTSSYSKYLEGGPTYLTYYQLDDIASKQDKELETVHSLVGGNTPNKYRQINNTVVYGVSTLDIVNELNERGLVSSINSEFIVVPDSLTPHQNDFFSFDYDGLRDHLFRVSDVQYDKASPGKYFRVQFEIFPDNAELIYDNIEGTYEMIYENIGTDSKSVISSEEAESQEKILLLVNSLSNKFIELFYNDETDSFLCDYKGKKIWSAYLQHFLNKNSILKNLERDFMNEIYVGAITEQTHPKFFRESVYQESLFRNLETRNKDVDFRNSFLDFNSMDIKRTRNLPFFETTFDYASLEPVKDIFDNVIIPGLTTDSQGLINENIESLDLLKDMGKFSNSFLFMFESPDNLFKDVGHYHKIHKFDEPHLLRINDFVKVGEIVFECKRNEIEPTGAFLKVKDQNLNLSTEAYENIGIDYIINKSEKEYNFLFSIIKKFLKEELVISESLLKEINNYSLYKRDYLTYILLPMVIYALKNN